MTSITIKPNLTSLPPEIMGFVLPDPSAIHGVEVVDKKAASIQRWLPFKHQWKGKIGVSNPQETLQDLRALSHTCHSLRAVALPRLWAVVHVKQVSELSKLLEILKENKYIAPLIRHFSWQWNMNGDYNKCDAYPQKHGSLLDMAFIDRGALWDRMRAKHRCEIELEFDDGYVYTSFTHNEKLFVEPGREPEWWEDIDDDYVMDAEECEEVYEVRGPNLDRVGPDGKGDDQRIKGPEDLIKYVTDVVVQLKSLQAFMWCCPVFAIPTAVFEALKQLQPQLTSLGIDMASRRGGFTALPIWELATRLQHLRLAVRDSLDYEPDKSPCEEINEASLASFELSRRPPTSAVKIEELHDKILSRTVVAAARAGHLKSLDMIGISVQRPFAVRALLPMWLGVEFDAWQRARYRWPEEKWLAARYSLHPTLSHASLWLPTIGSVSRSNRLLTAGEIMSLAAYFKKHGMPKIIKPERDNQRNRMAKRPLSIGTYLDWLAEDAQLSQSVAEAWERVVERGKADLVKCRCKQCQLDLRDSPKPPNYKEFCAQFGLRLDSDSNSDAS